jgi:ferredoxin
VTDARPWILVDRERCTGSGSCTFHAPETFDIDDAMKVVLIDGGGDSDEAIRSAVESCPTRALTIQKGH